MTHEERAELVERLRDTNAYLYPHLATLAMLEAANRIESSDDSGQPVLNCTLQEIAKDQVPYFNEKIPVLVAQVAGAIYQANSGQVDSDPDEKGTFWASNTVGPRWWLHVKAAEAAIAVICDNDKGMALLPGQRDPLRLFFQRRLKMQEMTAKARELIGLATKGRDATAKRALIEQAAHLIVEAQNIEAELEPDDE
jgi:hypothetical protein